MNNIYTGQGIAKDCIVGDVLMNRYAIFNGLELPRRIGPSLDVTLLGVDAAPTPTSAVLSATPGSLTDTKYYGWVAVYASTEYTRQWSVLDGSGNMTRGNPSAVARTLQITGANKAVDVTVATTAQTGITHVLLYRSLGMTDNADALAGPFYYVGQAVNTGASVTITDGLADSEYTGIAVEWDNYPPNAYRYATNINSFIFAGGNFPLGATYTCTVTGGSPTVTLDSDILYDGVKGWKFRCLSDTTGGLDGHGLYYATYSDAHTLTLVDETGTPKNYDGSLAGAGNEFTLYLPGNVLAWSKQGEPEAWPLDNVINFAGDITGLIQLSAQPLLLVCTDEPAMYLLDVNLIGTHNFITQKYVVSRTYSATSHYSLVNIEGKVRGIDASMGCIFEVNGTSVTDITKRTVPRIFSYLSNNMTYIKNWHCAYDRKQKLFGAFVTYQGAHRIVDFCIGQNIATDSWFFNWEKDLLCTGNYTDPVTGEFMVLGGTQGLGDTGAVWGRIWCPNVYDEWFPSGLRSGTIVSATGTTITVDNTDENLYTDYDGLVGRWVLVTNANDETAQLAYIKSNTADTITVDTVIGGATSLGFDPLPAAGWKFYIGLIECRWGPKLFDFGDPDTRKKVQEIWMCVHDHDTENLPVVRVYRGMDIGYLEQVTLEEQRYLGLDRSQTLANRVAAKLEPAERWGMSVLDRSYGPMTIRSISVVFLAAPYSQQQSAKREA